MSSTKTQSSSPCANCGRRYIKQRVITRHIDAVFEMCIECYRYRSCHWKDPETQNKCGCLSIDPFIKKSKMPLCAEHHEVFLAESAKKECKFKDACKNKKCIFKH